MSLASFAPPDVAPGMTSRDYFGSLDEWIFNTARALAERYAAGDQSMLDSLSGATASIGQPDRLDFGSTASGASTGTISAQTYNFFANYVKAYGTTDPWLTSQFGAPPARSATYIPDPSSPGALADKAAEEAAKDRAWKTEEYAKDRATDLEIAGIGAASARYSADRQFEAVSLQVENSWRIATMQDATDRYIAEGTWGVQKYVAELQESGAMDRLKLELGMRDKELAQRAIEEKNRYDVALKSLALEVAKYDAELAASPRNWLKYASWLQTRNIVVNGLSLAMAAQEVPEQAIDPATVAETAGPVAGLTTAQEQLASGTTGGVTSSQNPFGAGMIDLSGDTKTFEVGAQSGQPNLNYTPPPSAAQIGQMGAGDLANTLLGMSPGGATPAEASTGNLQSVMDSLSTTGKGRQASFGSYSGPTKNALGIDIGPEVVGSNVDYRKFSKLLPTQQEMKIGGIESVRGASGVNDWVAELERSRPKGGATGAASYG